MSVSQGQGGDADVARAANPNDRISQALNNLNVRPIVISSHPRSGTHASIDFFRRQFAVCRSWKYPGEGSHKLYLFLESLVEPVRGALSEEQALSILRRTPRPLIKSHIWLLDPEHSRLQSLERTRAHWIRWIRANAKSCYVYRDGRDVMSSYQIYRQAFDPAAHVPPGEFLRQQDRGISRVKAWADHVRLGINSPEVELIRYESLIEDPEAMLNKLERSLELTARRQVPLLPKTTRNRWQRGLARAFRMHPQSSAVIGREKGQTLLPWREHWTREDRMFFESEAGDLLIELGYETSDAWTRAAP
jgi:hypothetical protein